MPAGCTSSAASSATAAAGTPGPVRPGTCARIACGPLRGRRRLVAADALTRVGAIEIPVAAGRGGPAAVVPRQHPEAGDHALAAFVVAVEEIEHPLAVRTDDLPRSRELRRGGVTKRALPEADVAAGNVEVAGQPRELVWIRMTAVSS